MTTQESKAPGRNEIQPKMKKTSNKTDKPVDLGINSTKLIEQRPRSSGFKTFLNWFKKVENLQKPPESTDTEDESSEEDSSSSSTATVASFSFLPANKYKPYGDANPPEKYFSPGPYTETYHRLIMERNRRRSIDKNVTLRKKYSLYSSGTLTNHVVRDTTIEEDDQYESYDTFSLPTLSKINANNANECNDNRKTASLSSHYKKSHVKGKRRAPPPPNSNDFIRSYRKKRKAPPPPAITENIVIKEKIVNIKESPVKETLNPSVENSPKLWYKRENKQKTKPIAVENPKKKAKHEFPEVGFFRCSQLIDNIRNINNNNNKNDADLKNEKRSSRYLPNISELDREAAEIIKQNKSNGKTDVPYSFNNPSSARELITKFNALAVAPDINKNIQPPIQRKNEIKLSNELIINENKENKIEHAEVVNMVPREGDISKSFKSELFSALPNLAPNQTNDEKQAKLDETKQKLLDMEEKIKLRELLKEMKNSLPKRPKPNSKPIAIDDTPKTDEEVKKEPEIKQLNGIIPGEKIFNDILKTANVVKITNKQDPIYTNKVSSFAQTNGVLQKNDAPEPSKPNNSLYMNVEEAKSEVVKTKSEDNIPIHNNTNVLLKKLEQAIADGDDIAAANLAKELANLKVNCLVTCSPNVDEHKLHRIKIYIEDQFSHQGPIPLQIVEHTTMGQLKEKVEKELNIPKAAQRWIIGKQLAAKDDVALSEYNNKDFETPLFLYVIALEKTQPLEKPKLIIKEPPILQSTSTDNVPSNSKDNNVKTVNKVLINIEKKIFTPITSPASPELKNVTKNTWICTDCTLINSLLSPLCSACGLRKPDSIKDNKETERIDPVNQYKQLLNLDNQDLIPNIETFDCPICFLSCKPKDGVTLRECLHTFCKECLQNTIKYCEEAEIKCPYRDNVYFCDSVIQEREIRALVDKKLYEKHLAKSVKFAENKIQNTFHCKTPDCKGWCIFDDHVNHFICPACKKNNCLTCQVIHEGLNCKEYQDQMNNKASPADKNEGQQTKNMLDEMVKKGEALACPSCEVIMMKKWGCDWVRCSMCKTEICWVTRGPRWGPAGKGDVSAGCQCGINGVKCHPKCNYCH